MNALLSEVQPSQPALVSVVIPAFNAGETLAQTLDSVLAQTYPNVEIVVVDDGSTDATANVLREYGERVRSVRQPNGGLPKARNTGCALARGDFIALMDADDLCEPERIAVQAYALQHHPKAVLCSTDFSAFNRDGPVERSYGGKYYSMIRNASEGLASLYPERSRLEVPMSSWSGSKEPIVADAHVGSVYRDIAGGNFVHPPTVMFRREVMVAAGPFDESLPYSSDWEWFVRVARIGAFVHVDLPLLRYRLSERQMSSTRVNRGQSSVDIVRAATKIWHSDPELRAARPGFRARRGQLCYIAAEELAEVHKLDAARMLAASIWQGFVRPATLRTAMKIAMPNNLLNRVRSMRQWLLGLVVTMPYALDGFLAQFSACCWVV